ncbi:MAG: S8 family serine peptidase [Xanthomonadales bacterium]|nr:S8 family serine peptidase [Xanthomonadales bacterium]
MTNAIAASVPESLLPQIAARPDVAQVISDAPYRQQPPLRSSGKLGVTPIGVPWGVQKIRAPEAWAALYRGQGVVVGGQDTGYQWDHPALKEKYRGWNGGSADHNYSWHDAIRSLIPSPSGPQTNSCGLDLAAPCDDDGHGSHTMGTMVGDDGVGSQPGVAPDAKWIGCRNMEEGWGRASTYMECFEWFIAPTDLAGNNPDPSKAPDVINNSWGCPPTSGGEDCDAAEIDLMRTVVNNVRDAGVVVVVSAGNDGPGCSTITSPAAIYASSHTVGATDSNDAIANFSSRGPNPDGLLKPNVSAPGVDVCSSIPGSTYACGWNGTSMAGPHVAGTVALMISANPSLRGDPDTIESILESTAVPLTSAQTCGAFSGTSVPNAVFGYGRIDAYAAVQAALAVPMFKDGFE